MSKIYIPAKKPDDWKPLLARPEQWKKRHSAWALAHSWQDAEGFPEKLRLVFVNSGLQLFRSLELLFAFPEYTVALPGRGQSSHNDIMAIAKGNGQIVVIAVEGKAEEEFGPTVKPEPEQEKTARLPAEPVGAERTACAGRSVPVAAPCGLRADRGRSPLCG